MEFLAEYGMFLAKTITFVFCTLLLLRSLFPLGRTIDQDQAGHLEVSHLNERYARLVQDMSAVVLDKKKLKHFKKEKKKAGAIVGITHFSLPFAQYVLKGCEVNQFITGSDLPPPWQSLEPLASTSLPSSSPFPIVLVR